MASRWAQSGAVLTLLSIAAFGLPAHAGGPAAFVHPGLYHDAGDLAFMRDKIENRKEPWRSAWDQLRSSAKLKWTPHPVAEWNANANPYMDGDAMAAHGHALQWALTGEQPYADKAIEILDAWSSALRIIVGTTSQEMVVCGWNGCHLANAAELLLTCTPPGGRPSGWRPEAVAGFKSMLGLMVSKMKDFKPGFNGNWDAAMMNSLLCIAVFCDDHRWFEHVIRHFHGNYSVANPNVSRNGHLTGYILPSGQCQESGRDQGHVQMGLGNYLSLCEVAWKQGVDLYASYDNRLAKGLEYTAAYLLGEDALPFEPNPRSSWMKISASGRGQFGPIWEMAYQHYVLRRGLPMPFTTRIVFGQKLSVVGRKQPCPYRPEPALPNTGICWGTLTAYRGKP